MALLGERAIALSPTTQILHEQSLAFGSAQAARDPLSWKAMLFELLGALPKNVRSQLKAIVINGSLHLSLKR